MKLSNIYLQATVAAVACVMASCSDDLGNYAYTDVNEISIDETKGGLVSGKRYDFVAHVDHICFSPEIVSSTGATNDADYEYEWKLVKQGENTEYATDEMKVISRERCIDQMVVSAPGNYYGFFNVKDKSTGIVWSTPFYVNVRSLVGEGWFVLCDVNDETRIDIVFNKTETEDIVARDVLSGTGSAPGKPRKLFYNFYTGSRGTTMLVTDKDTYVLDKTDLHAADDNRLAWRFGFVPDKLGLKASHQTCYSGRDQWIVIDDNDDVYSMSTGDSGSVFGYPVNRIDNDTPFTPAPFIGANINKNSWGDGMQYCHPAVLYDQTHSQFVQLTNFGNYPKVMEFKNNNEFFANPTDGKQMVAMYNLSNGVIKAVLRDPATSETYYYAMSLLADVIWAENWWEDDEFIPYNKQLNFCKIDGDGIDHAGMFAFHGMYEYLFYVADNKVYQFDLSNPSQKAKEVLSFPGEEIVKISFSPSLAWNAYTDWERAREFQLAVATNVNGESADKCGRMRFYNVPALMAPLTEIKTIDGFGKIVDFVLKEHD